MATVPQQAVARNRRVLADVGNLINGQPALANHQKQVLVPVKNCRKAIPQVAARSRGVLADVGNHINGCRAPANRQKPLVAASDRNGKAVKLKELSKVKPEVIVLSSDSEKEKKTKVSGGQRIARRVPTLTHILTTCSRV